MSLSYSSRAILRGVSLARWLIVTLAASS